MGLNRVVFYSINDMASGHELSKAEPILLKSEITYKSDDINDIIELDQIRQYINNDLFLDKWTEEDKLKFKEKVNSYNDHIGRFFATINSENIVKYYNQLEFDYKRPFWRLINDQKAYKRISNDTFEELINQPKFWIEDVLYKKGLVDHFKVVLRRFLLNDKRSAEILMTAYEEKQKMGDSPKIYFPDNLTVKDKEDIICRYLDLDDANLNYVRLILNIRDKSELKISDKIRLKAKRKEQIENDKLLSQGTGIRYGVSVTFSEEQIEPFICRSEDGIIYYSYSTNLLKENQENIPFLFKIFTFLFDFLDHQLRIDLVNKKYELDILETIFIQSKNEYIEGHSFILKRNTSHLQLIAYEKTLQRLNVNLEDIISSYFNTYLRDKYSINNFNLIFPSKGNSHFEKIRILAPEFESLLKKYKLYVTEGEIDLELLQISSKPSSIADMPSLQDRKYFYLQEDNEHIKKVQYLFFSDQSPLAYMQKFKSNRYKCLFDLLLNEQVKYTDFESYRKDIIQFLIDEKYLTIINGDILDFDNLERIVILKDLFENEVVSFWHYPLRFRKIIDEMVSQDMLYFTNSLFTKPEQDYFNYYLNKSEFTNGLDLRNKYLHGTQASTDKEDEHENSYFILLKLLILAICKIEDDLHINKIINKMHQNS